MSASVEPGREPETNADYFEGVEFFKGDVWLWGRVARSHHRRLSDVLNHTSASLLLHDAVVGASAGPTGPVAGHQTWIDLRDIDLIGHTAIDRSAPRGEQGINEHVAKRPQRLTVWTASHEIHGTVHLYPEADLESFLRSDDPPLIAMTDAEVSWVTPGRATRTFPFVLLNRRRVFATRAD
jgi:hypothetical protein